MLRSHGAFQWVGYVIGIAAAIVVVRQCRRPTWLPGRLLATVMNRSHAALTEWGLEHVAIDPRATILDVGCGGGAAVRRLASIAVDGKVFGVDYAPASVATARRTNGARIAAGQVDIQLASVSALPFPADTFSVVTAVETHYYWPNLRENLHEILRVLEPGGTVVLIAEAYRGRRDDWLYRPAMRLLGGAYLSKSEHCEVLAAAGFADVSVFENRAKGWICVRGTKAARA